ncbi:MAG: epimerase [Dehalococcoidales bacterium]|jgi:nucleoside-diphosphate-sugar epimerase|nr:epimerase [Dehalococcoidales bacterium]|tara:strand:- start:6950 stop:7927 length:978 start_codon:yes stop_codon:yes gene_type:complete
MKVLVTGSSGFIGTHLVHALAASGESVLGVDIRPPKSGLDGFRFRECDILDAPTLHEIVAQFSPHCVVHLAARTDLDEKADLREGYAANITGVENMVAAIRDAESVQRCIYTSTQLVCPVGYTPESDLDYRPHTLYGESKVLGEKIVREHDGGGVVWCIVRPTTVWGPGMNPHYQRFFRMIADGRYFHVGYGALRKSYGYVGNVAHQYAKLLCAAAEDIHGVTLYLADYEPLSLREWAGALSCELGSAPIRTIPEGAARVAAICGDLINACGFRGFPFNSFRLRNVLTEYRVDLSYTEKVCGLMPYTMEQGVKDTARWYRYNDNI